jgi:hypothetical protein
MIAVDKDGNVLAESANGYEWTMRSASPVIVAEAETSGTTWTQRSQFGASEIATIVLTPEEAEIMSWIMDRWHSGESTD